ncbi:MAG: ABC transporter permease [bacterium]
MTTFLLRRFLQAAVVFAIVISASFLLIRAAPGSPFSSERALDPAVEARLLEKYGLNGTLTQQFFYYWKNLLKGDLGESLKYTNRSVVEILAQALPQSLLLGACALALALSAGIFLGVTAAMRHDQWQDRAAMLLALTGICLPTFLIAPLCVLVFGLWLRLFPVAGWGAFSYGVLPVVCLAAPYAAYCSRLARSSMLEALGQDFIRTARAKGLPERLVAFRHALKVAVLPIVSYSGPLAAHILTGSLVIEEIFCIPGLGPFFINSVLNRDVFVAGGAVMIYSGLLIFFNAFADVLLAALDKRIRLT